VRLDALVRRFLLSLSVVRVKFGGVIPQDHFSPLFVNHYSGKHLSLLRYIMRNVCVEVDGLILELADYTAGRFIR